MPVAFKGPQAPEGCTPNYENPCGALEQLGTGVGARRMRSASPPCSRRQTLSLFHLHKITDVDQGRVTATDLHGNGQADVIANLWTDEHLLWIPLRSGITGLTLRTRSSFSGNRLARSLGIARTAGRGSGYRLRLLSQVFPEAPHLRVVRHEVYLQCLGCTRQTGKFKGECNASNVLLASQRQRPGVRTPQACPLALGLRPFLG
eukprot:3340693-Amphidinium_carterae.1